MDSKRKIWLPHFWMLYLLPAFVWWAMLLWKKNELVFEQQHALADLKALSFVEKEAEHLRISEKHLAQRRMILAEGAVFVLLLVWGLHRIFRSFKKEILVAQQQRNFQLSITHELKSPIAAVQLTLETLLKRDFPLEKRQKLLQTALKDNKRLHLLVEDILLSASLENLWKPNKERVYLPEFIENELSILQRAFPNVQLQLNCGEDLPLTALDASAFRSVLTNLVENAVKYCSTEKPRIEIEIKHDEKNIFLSVKDNGPGIALSEKSKIFQKFYRIGNEDTRNAKGTGLGLFIVQKVVEAHGGKVSVSDNQPHGTVFTIKLNHERTVRLSAQH